MKTLLRVAVALICLVVPFLFVDSCLASEEVVCPEGWTYQERDGLCSTNLSSEEQVAEFGKTGFQVKISEFCENGKGGCEELFPGVSKTDCKDSCVLFDSQSPPWKIKEMFETLFYGLIVIPCDGREYAEEGKFEGGDINYLARCKDRELELFFVPPYGQQELIGCPEGWTRTGPTGCKSPVMKHP